MTHTHGDSDPGHDRHGGDHGLGWELLDSIMLGCAMLTAGLLAEMLYKRWRAARVRYDLTPAGLAVTNPHTCSTTTTEALCAACKTEGSPWHKTRPLIDEEALRAAVARGDLGRDQPGSEG